MTKIVHVVLSNNDSAVFVNDSLIYALDGNEGGELPLTVAQRLAESMPDGVIQRVSMDVPDDADWNWNDVLELIPASDGVQRKMPAIQRPCVAELVGESCEQVMAP
ncbi:hypothetical protein [Devosia sp.]|uniref:hypothetical protein n=1 Tax=Devosia sp. TaxID=1871048 RepID=UPI002735AB6B|nr:hypothetical protein [Devosia sp.]MDP2782259.1 hypothetical protein [Devosia sp.]